MSTRAHEYIGLSPITMRGSVCSKTTTTCICMEVMRACMFEYHFTTLMWRVRRKSYNPHIERDRFMTCRCTSHFDSMGGIHAYTCMCVCAKVVSCMSSQSENNNPLLSQINLSCCQAKSSDGPSGPTDGKHRYR